MHPIDKTATTPANRTQLNKRVPHTLDGLNPNKTEQVTTENAATKAPPPVLSMPPTTSSLDKPTDTPAQTSQSEAVKTDEVVSVEEIEAILNASVKILKDNELGVTWLQI